MCDLILNCYKGHLKLTAITPVIEALFGSFDLGKGEVVEGKLDIFKDLGNTPSYQTWDDVADILKQLALEKYDTQIDNFTNIKGVLLIVCPLVDPEYRSDDLKKAKLKNLMLTYDFSETPSVGNLLQIAQYLDDGHGLEELNLDLLMTYHNIDGERLIHQTVYATDEIIYSCQSDGIETGRSLDAYLRDNDYESVAGSLAFIVNKTLKGISDPKRVKEIRKLLTQKIQR